MVVSLIEGRVPVNGKACYGEWAAGLFIFLAACFVSVSDMSKVKSYMGLRSYLKKTYDIDLEII